MKFLATLDTLISLARFSWIYWCSSGPRATKSVIFFAQSNGKRTITIKIQKFIIFVNLCAPRCTMVSKHKISRPNGPINISRLFAKDDSGDFALRPPEERLLSPTLFILNFFSHLQRHKMEECARVLFDFWLSPVFKYRGVLCDTQLVSRVSCRRTWERERGRDGFPVAHTGFLTPTRRVVSRNT